MYTTHKWEVYMYLDTLPWSNEVWARSFFTEEKMNYEVQTLEVELMKFPVSIPGSSTQKSNFSHLIPGLMKFECQSSSQRVESYKPWQVKLPIQILDEWCPLDTKVSYVCLKSALKKPSEHHEEQTFEVIKNSSLQQKIWSWSFIQLKPTEVKQDPSAFSQVEVSTHRLLSKSRSKFWPQVHFNHLRWHVLIVDRKLAKSIPG